MKRNSISYSAYRASQKDFNSGDGIIKYIDQGTGPVILLIHGVPTSGWLYRHIMEQITQNGYRVIAPDMLGYGSSDSPNGYSIYSEENHAQRILDLMDFLEIENWTHVMHDAGGLWTWELFKKQPNRITKLVVLNTIIYQNGFAPPIRFEEGFIAKMAMWSYRNGITTSMMLKGLFKSGLKENTLTKKDLKGYKKPMLEGKTKAMYYFFTQTCKSLPDYSEVIKSIDVPVAVIWGTEDSFLKWEPQKNEVMKDLKIASENVHMLDARHFIQEEKPDKISRLILNFID